MEPLPEETESRIETDEDDEDDKDGNVLDSNQPPEPPPAPSAPVMQPTEVDDIQPAEEQDDLPKKQPEPNLGPSLFPDMSLQEDDDFEEVTDDPGMGEQAQSAIVEQMLSQDRVRSASDWVQSSKAQDEAIRLWSHLAQKIHRTQLPVEEYIDEVVPLSYQQGELIVGVPQSTPDHHKDLLLSYETLQRLRQLLQQETGRKDSKLRMPVVLVDFNPADRNRKRELVSNMEIWKRMEKHPYVRQLVETFEGQLVDVRG